VKQLPKEKMKGKGGITQNQEGRSDVGGRQSSGKGNYKVRTTRGVMENGRKHNGKK